MVLIMSKSNSHHSILTTRPVAHAILVLLKLAFQTLNRSPYYLDALEAHVGCISVAGQIQNVTTPFTS